MIIRKIRKIRKKNIIYYNYEKNFVTAENRRKPHLTFFYFHETKVTNEKQIILCSIFHFHVAQIFYKIFSCIYINKFQ